jgi:hypothetical protein
VDIPVCPKYGGSGCHARRQESQLQNTVFEFAVLALCRRKQVNGGAGGRRFRRHSAGTTGAPRFLLILQLAQECLRHLRARLACTSRQINAAANASQFPVPNP